MVIATPPAQEIELKVIPSQKKPAVQPVKVPIKPRVTRVKFRDTSAYLVLLATTFMIITISVVSLTVAYFVNGRRR